MIQVQSKTLLAGLNAVVNRGLISTYPIINCVLIEAGPGKLSLRTSNLEPGGDKIETVRAEGAATWATAAPMILKVEISDPYRVKRPSKRTLYPLIDYLKATGDATITLDHDPYSELLIIRDATSRATFKCINAQEFPPIKQ